MTRLFLCFALPALTACGPVRQTPSPAPPGAGNPMIFSAILRLSADGQDKHLAAESLLLGPGKLKASGQLPSVAGPGDLRCSFLNQRRQPVLQLIVPNPLKRQLEYADDAGQLRRLHVADTAAVFSLRVNWQPDMAYLKVEEFQDGKKIRLLAILSIQPDRL